MVVYMKNGLYLTTLNVYSKESSTQGIHLKILNQVKSLNIEDQTKCKIYILPAFKRRNHLLTLLSMLFVDIYKKIYIDLYSYDFVYIRNIQPVTYSYIKMLKMLKKYNNKIKIILEIPTYPYNNENDTLRKKIVLLISKIPSLKLKKYVDRVVTFSTHNEILGIKTIKTINGITCADIHLRKPKPLNQDINLIAVAYFSYHHGYERLLEGLYNYYKQEFHEKVYIHFVGEGDEVNLYKKLVNQYQLSKYVIFYNALQGENLTNVYNIADMAINSLGCHKINIYLSSALKSREYLARGIPMVSSTKIDVLPEGFKFCFYVPEDESPIDIKTVVQYYNNLTAKYNVSEMVNEIRDFAEDHCEMTVTMKPVIDYIKGI